MDSVTLERYREDTFELPISIKSDDDEAIDLTGYTIGFGLAGYNETTPGVTIYRQDADGFFTVTVSDTLMAALTEKAYSFYIELVSPLNVRQTILAGTLALFERYG